MHYRFSEIAKRMDGECYGANGEEWIKQIYFDSREIYFPQGGVFIAIQGVRDGHQFLRDAYAKGIRHFIVERWEGMEDLQANYIIVDNSLQALQRFAIFHRSQWDIPVIGITGSNGKTIVKEWLAILLGTKYKVRKSPLSYNSQLGAALSVLGIEAGDEMALFEAGISEKGEMARLQTMIQPTIGVLTHFGDAHQEQFASFSEKLSEKWKLFEGCGRIFALANHEEVWKKISENPDGRVISISKTYPASWRYKLIGYELVLESGQQHYRFQVIEREEGYLENLALSLVVALEHGISQEIIKEEINILPHLPMRLEWIFDNSDYAFIIDSWCNDGDSLYHAVRVLEDTPLFKQKKIIITDFDGSSEKLEARLSFLLSKFSGQDIYGIGNGFRGYEAKIKVYEDVKDFLERARIEEFHQSVILLKGSRKYRLERVYDYFNQKAHATYVKVRINDLKHNFRYYKSLAGEGVKMMVMLKADSYGGGSWELGRVLEEQGADYLGVAYTGEGIDLRKHGIRLPIMVMNPDTASIHQLKTYKLEPSVGSLDFLMAIKEQGLLPALKLHIEVETGMNRMGLSLSEIEGILGILKRAQVVSVYTHLASAEDEKSDDFSKTQLELLKQVRDIFHLHGLKVMAHGLNTVGIERWSGSGWDMVRLGIGFYGYSASKETQEAIEMYSKITRIRKLLCGEGVSYGLDYVADAERWIATVPVGYADGLDRRLSNGNWCFQVAGVLCPIVGRICMDMTMIDVTNVKEAKVGDEVLIFGGKNELSLKRMSNILGTIAYECLVRIPHRVQRIYVEE